MRIQFAAVIKDRNGEDVMDSVLKKPITLAAICCGVLDITFQDEANEGLKAKLRRAELMEKISEAEKTLQPLDLLDADREMLKERVAKRPDLSVSIVANVAKLLDAEVAKEVANKAA